MISEQILRSFDGKNILVTGGTGLIGRQVVSILAEAGASIRVASLDQVSLEDRCEHIYGDLSEMEFCRSVVMDMDYVFHLAGIKGSVEATLTKPASFFVPLLQMNTNVLESCRLQGTQKVVYTSSIGAYSPAEVLHLRPHCRGRLGFRKGRTRLLLK